MFECFINVDIITSTALSPTLLNKMYSNKVGNALVANRCVF